jgi:hypothetical protein
MNARQNAGKSAGLGKTDGIRGFRGKWADVSNKKLVPNYEDSAHRGHRMVPLGEFRFRRRAVRFVAYLCP